MRESGVKNRMIGESEVTSTGLENKTWSSVGYKSQSLVSSLLVNLLLQLTQLWHWLQQILFSEPNCSNTNTSKMTIEVSAFTDAMVNPDQELQHEEEEASVLKYSLPITRLNSESVETEDEDILLEFNQQSQSVPTAEDSCSGYCSGSGCSLPGSPIPNKEPEDHDQDEVDEEKTSPAILDRRDSGGTSDSSVDADADVEVTPEVVARIVSQVESMFSDDHLAKDGFLLKHVRRRSDGFVSLKLVAGLRKVKQISREFPVVLTSLKKSEKLEVNPDGTKVRRKEPLTPGLKSMPIKQAKKEKSQSEKNQAEKENQVGLSGNHHSNSNGSGRDSLTDEQQIARRRRRGDRLNELQFERPERGSFSKPSSGRSSIDETPIRRRGGSLPIASSLSQHRGSTGNYLYPNASPPNAAGFLRPKSNSYSEGTDPAAATMSSWLQKRKASASSRLSNGDISLAGVIRQPRGPDGTKGFHPGYRSLILEERLQTHMANQLSSLAA